MSSKTTAVQARPGEPAAHGPPGVAGRALGWSATGAIIVSILVMIGASLLRSSWMPPKLLMPSFGPPWELSSVHVSFRAIVVALWLAALLGAAGIAAGLLAVRRGLPVPIRTLLTAGLLGLAVLTVLPPVGSTDPLDYAVYGHIAALGHSPYFVTPGQYVHRLHGLPGVPLDWRSLPSVYGPLATLEQLVAAKLGSASLAATVFWLKLMNAAAFAAIALVADRLLRSDKPARLRAHLFWTANPLLLWSLIAGGHVDVLAAAAGLAGLLILDRWASARPLVRALAAGLCIGIAVDIKAVYALFGLAVAVALWRRPAELLTAALGAVVLLPAYAVAGRHAFNVLLARATGAASYELYAIFFRHLGINYRYMTPLAAVLAVAVAVLALWRMPAGFGGQPAVRAGLALSVAWLFVWPHQFAWYSVMIVCVLIFYPASRLDWLVLIWLTAITLADLPGVGKGSPRFGHVLSQINITDARRVAPFVLIGVLVALVVLCLGERWNVRSRPDGVGA